MGARSSTLGAAGLMIKGVRQMKGGVCRWRPLKTNLLMYYCHDDWAALRQLPRRVRGGETMEIVSGRGSKAPASICSHVLRARLAPNAQPR